MATKKALHKSRLSFSSFSSFSFSFSKLRRQPSGYNCCNYQNAPTSPPTGGGGATLADIDRYIFDNFNSLYSPYRDVGPKDLSPRFTDPPAEDVRPSKRFFVKPVPTGSLVEEARLNAASKEADGTAAVVKVSADPYVDFRASMQEMVDGRNVDKDGPLDWGFLERLLACYLELNEKSVHECILRAFIDLTEELGRKKNVRDGKRVL